MPCFEENGISRKVKLAWDLTFVTWHCWGRLSAIVRVCSDLSAFLPQNLLHVCLAVWLAIRRLAVPLGWLHHFTPYPLHSQWQPQPRETWVMVLSDVHPDSIELDGRHTPKITKAGERQRGDWVGEREGRSQAIDKAGTHCLIKIYFFFLPLAIRLGRAERGRRECD